MKCKINYTYLPFFKSLQVTSERLNGKSHLYIFHRRRYSLAVFNTLHAMRLFLNG